ncbi:hypothetical protein PILCRDRAFT_88182 [Piloderma croceum F 1598]|uniref:Uncharacterized protein n=1 Tax=Piloderma croceum (strain F 1598) TaxID=765440 RepID=A0A0C3FG38_PILCF|nr:hypothetical protein PILCRDRAFT_88182 [Piloderma croceum F 1598]
MTAPMIYITVTAFFGCPSGATWPSQPDRGRTPLRATANMSLEEATMRTLVFCSRDPDGTQSSDVPETKHHNPVVQAEVALGEWREEVEELKRLLEEQVIGSNAVHIKTEIKMLKQTIADLNAAVRSPREKLTEAKEKHRLGSWRRIWTSLRIIKRG